MKRVIQSVICLSALLIVNSASAGAIKNFRHAQAALEAGHRLEIVTMFKQCETKFKRNIVGVVVPNAFLTLHDKKIAASDTHFTLSHHLKNSHPVYEHVKYEIFPDNHVTITSTMLDAKTLTTIGKARKFKCQLGRGVKLYKLKA